MFVFDPRTLTAPTTWLLKAEVVLSRRHDIPIGTPPWRLEPRARYLLRRYFPDVADEPVYDLDWPTWAMLMQRLFYQVEQSGWFEIDWELVDDLGRMSQEMHWEEDDPFEMDDGLSMMSEFLDGIPVRLYGFGTDEVWGADDIGLVPPLALLDAMLGGSRHMVSNCKFDDYPVFDDLDYFPGIETAETILLLLEDLAPAWEPPFNLLPLLARYAIGQTGNVLLDERRGAVWDYDPYRWQWDREADLNMLKSWYVGARPTLDAVEQLMAWFEVDPLAEIRNRKLIQIKDRIEVIWTMIE